MRPGCIYEPGKGCEFNVWAPLVDSLSLRIVSRGGIDIPMEKNDTGHFRLLTDSAVPGDRYIYLINGEKERPDPLSHFQPDGVLGPSCVVDHTAFEWDPVRFECISPEKMIIYELHTGTFTASGTFKGIAEKIPYLKDLGVNAIEIMPVAQFPGKKNWGYDGVYPFAVQDSYGGPVGLKELVSRCHGAGIAVILDVVYNHLGPEGNFLPEFMPCFTDRFSTPWGKAINFDDAYSYGIRDLFISNALYWFEYYDIDALRLDAVHGIFDMSAKHFLSELREKVDEFSENSGRRHYLIAESDLNDTRIIDSPGRGGYGMHAQWNDDFHHALHTLLTGESAGYYSDFGKMEHLEKAVREGFVYSWDFSEHRKRYHGTSSSGVPHSKFVVFAQNHDQVGNRMNGERLFSLTGFERAKLAAGMVILSSGIPLIFMGEEYAESAPFLYFADHSDTALINAVREGRKREFKEFHAKGDPPDPFDDKTFLRSKPSCPGGYENEKKSERGIMFALYKHLIEFRKNSKEILTPEKIEIRRQGHTLSSYRYSGKSALLCVFNFSEDPAISGITESSEEWIKVFDSSEAEWSLTGSCDRSRDTADEKYDIKPLSFCVYRRDI